MEDAMLKEREKCTKSKVELINMKGKYQRMEKHLQDVQEANKIDNRLMQERLSFTAFEVHFDLLEFICWQIANIHVEMIRRHNKWESGYTAIRVFRQWR